MTVRRRRITVRGVKPVGAVQHQFANAWCFGCVAPCTGEAEFVVLPKLNAENMQLFLDTFAQRHAETLNVLIVDRSGAHTAKALVLPENVVLVFLPPSSPELNGIERVWEDVRGRMAWKTFAHLDCLLDELEAVLGTYSSDQLRSLSGYDYLVQAELAITS